MKTVKIGYKTIFIDLNIIYKTNNNMIVTGGKNFIKSPIIYWTFLVRNTGIPVSYQSQFELSIIFSISFIIFNLPGWSLKLSSISSIIEVIVPSSEIRLFVKIEYLKI